MNETKDLEIGQILPKDNIEGIKKDISNKINIKICEKNYSEHVKTQIQKEINDIIENEIEKLRINAMSLSNKRKRKEEIRKQNDELYRLQNEIKQLQEESLKKENQQKERIEKIEKQHQEELQKLKEKEQIKEQNRYYEELIHTMQIRHTQEMKVLSDQIKILQNKIDSNPCFIM